MPKVEAELFKSLDPSSIDVAIDGWFNDFNPNSQNKAIHRLKAEILKKSEKVKDALEKTWPREVGKKDILEQNAKDKAGSSMEKKTNVWDEVTSIVLDEVLQAKPPSKRGIKQDSSQLSVTIESLTLGQVVVDLGDDADVHVNELIIYSSLALLISKNGLQSQAFCDVVSFIEKVMHPGPLIL